jgi:protein farnesyltransferase subunit beta
MKLPDGSFRMHRGGEIDVRAVYCAVVVAKLTNLSSEDLFVGTAEWIAK